jgi:tetratricopeptide (TPR) repeat protein
MATKKKPNMAATSMESSSVRPRRPPNARRVQNFHLVWLDGSIDEINNDDCRNSITELRQIVNTVNTFTDVDECIDFITDMKDEMTLMIISEAFSSIIVPIVEAISQVSSIYIICENKAQHEKLVQQWSKLKGIYTDITSICEALKQAVQHCDQNSVSISFVKSTDGTSNQNLDQLDQSFMYTQILKEILLTIDFEQVHINEFLTYCREQFVGNTAELKNFDEFEKEYRHHRPIWWYTYKYFLYSMVNRALRKMEVDLIIRMGFFIRDLHNHIAELHTEQYGGQNHSDSFIVYRGQGLSQTDFNQLMETKGGLMSFNNFLSTSRNQQVSLAFAESNQYNPDLVGVLFKIRIDPSISTSPFGNVRNVSYYEEEEEILFSMHSVFRIGQVKEIDNNDRLWQVDLALTSENDPQLHALTKCMQEETKGTTGWLRLGKLMIKLGHFDKAEELYEILLQQTTNEGIKAHLFHHLELIRNSQGKYAEAIEFHEKSLEIKQKILPENHPDFAQSYNNIGTVYTNMGEFSKALSYYEKALEIYQKTLPPNHPHLATFYNNIGAVYDNMGEYSKALSYYEKALEIWQKSLPENHPDLASSYNNIGQGYYKMGEYSRALSYYEKALEIFQKTLPENHPDLATSYNNIGFVYENVGEYSKALSYYEKAVEIRQKTLPANHPDLASSHFCHGSLYNKMGEYSKALSYYEKALEIRQKTLSASHPILASSYNNIGLVYNSMGEYSKALSYYGKSLEIWQKTLPANHPSLASSYNNIGLAYNNMGEYSKALSYYEKALEIRQKTLLENHPDLASSYNNIGLVYNSMGEYSKALSYYEKSLEIWQKTLPANHPSLASSYNNIGLAYNNMGEYSKALSYYEKALEIWQKTLPANHPDLATSYVCHGSLYNEMGDYSKAFSYYEKALEIRQKTLPANHPHLASSYNDIGTVYCNMDEYSKALSHYERALSIFQGSLPPNHPHIQTVRKGIEYVLFIKNIYLIINKQF